MPTDRRRWIVFLTCAASNALASLCSLSVKPGATTKVVGRVLDIVDEDVDDVDADENVEEENVDDVDADESVDDGVDVDESVDEGADVDEEEDEDIWETGRMNGWPKKELH